MAGPSPLALSCALLLACNGGGDGPSEPVGLQIGGTWTQTSEVVADPCDLIFLWGPATTTLRIAQLGAILTLIRDDEEIGSGSLTPATGDFVLSGSIAQGGATIDFVQRGTFTSSTRYTAETELLIQGSFFACEARTTDIGTR